MGRQRQQHEGDPDHDQRRAGQVGDALAAPIFSRVITTPSAAIQITFITPTANITNIIAQQQPRQYHPCLTPRRKTARGVVAQLAL